MLPWLRPTGGPLERPTPGPCSNRTHPLEQGGPHGTKAYYALGPKRMSQSIRGIKFK